MKYFKNIKYQWSHSVNSYHLKKDNSVLVFLKYIPISPAIISKLKKSHGLGFHDFDLCSVDI